MVSAPRPQPAPERVILHVDMDAFFASVAQLDRPELQGKPVIVGGHSLRRGVVSSCSYEARAFGVRNAMPLYKAMQLCPGAIVVRVEMGRYRDMNERLREIWSRYSPLVEVASFDEAYLDLTGSRALLGEPLDVARRLQAEIRDVTGLPCTVGIGPNKLLAKVASKRGKPAGLCAVPRGEELAWLAPLRVTDLHGIGEATARRLADLGINRVGHLQAMSEAELARCLGAGSEHLVRMARGQDDRPLTPSSPAKSIGAERTFDDDLRDAERLKAILFDLVQEVAFRARRGRVLARTVSVKIRYRDFETIERERTLPVASDDDQAFAALALELLRAHSDPARPLRLLGVRLSNFTTTGQLSLFDGPQHEAQQQLNKALDRLRERHGLYVVSRATHLAREARDRATRRARGG